MKNLIKKVTFFVAVLSLLLLGSNKAFADSKTLQCGVIPQQVCNVALQAQASTDNPAGGLTPIIQWAANIIVAIFGAVAVLIVVASGIQISASAGNENVVKQAKENIFKVVTALVLLISFRAILEIIQGLFSGVDTFRLFQDSGQLASGGIPKLLGNVGSVLSFASGVVSLIFIVIGGIRYTTSGGNSNALTGAKKTLIYAIAGLVISISAYGILGFISQQLQK